jgi:hypothetical protein
MHCDLENFAAPEEGDPVIAAPRSSSCPPGDAIFRIATCTGAFYQTSKQVNDSLACTHGSGDLVTGKTSRDETGKWDALT